MDDLGSATYEVFERDPVKYRLYEEAVCQALMDRPEQGVTYVVILDKLRRLSANVRVDWAIE
jgi:protein arginine N-methyltransferase 5